MVPVAPRGQRLSSPLLELALFIAGCLPGRMIKNHQEIIGKGNQSFWVAQLKDHLLKERRIPLEDSWDVIVVGGGPSGCAAAAACAREGAETLLIEATGALGGMGTLGLVPWFCGYHDGEKIIARGLAERVLRACRDGTPHLKEEMERNPLATPAIDPELLKTVYDDMVRDLGAEVLFCTSLAAVERSSDSEVDTLIVSNKHGLSALRAKVYVDCTGDGDLAAWAGAEYEKGDESGEMQPGSLCFAICNVDEEALAKGPRVHFYDPDSPVHEAIRSRKYPDIVDLHSCNIKTGPGTYGFNTGHVYGLDNTDPVSISQNLVLGRRIAAQYHEAFSKLHPAFSNSFLVATGGLIGARETRRILGDYYLTIQDYLNRRSFDDEICRNAYGIDVHSPRKTSEALARMSVDEIRGAIKSKMGKLERGESFGVPYRCLTPRNIKNVLVAGRCISTDRQVNGSIRIMACCLNTGEAAGIAAAMAVDDGDVHRVNSDELRRKLRRFGAYLPD